MRPHHRRGFTLVEVLIASSILLTSVGAALSVFVSVNRSIYGLSDAIDLNARTRITQERVLFDVRSISKVTQADAQTFTGEFVEYGTGRTGTLSYSLVDNKLIRRITLTGEATQTTTIMEALQTAADLASTSRFNYANRSGVATSTAAEVRSIQIGFVPLATNRQKHGLVTGRNETFCSAVVQLRNISS